jgi:hypothetical protein
MSTSITWSYPYIGIILCTFNLSRILISSYLYYYSLGIKVNEYLQSVSNPAVYAAGDVVAVATGSPQLTPVATYDGKIVAANLLKGIYLCVRCFTRITEEGSIC